MTITKGACRWASLFDLVDEQLGSEAELIIQHIQPLVELVADLREVGDFGKAQLLVK